MSVRTKVYVRRAVASSHFCITFIWMVWESSVTIRFKVRYRHPYEFSSTSPRPASFGQRVCCLRDFFHHRSRKSHGSFRRDVRWICLRLLAWNVLPAPDTPQRERERARGSETPQDSTTAGLEKESTTLPKRDFDGDLQESVQRWKMVRTINKSNSNTSIHNDD